MVRISSYLLMMVMALLLAGAATAAPLTHADFTGTVTGDIVDKAPDGRWAVVQVTATEPANAELTGKQLRMRVAFTGQTQPDPEQAAAVLALIKAGNPVTLQVRPAGKAMIMSAPDGGGGAPAEAKPAPPDAGPLTDADLTGKVVKLDAPRFFVMEIQKVEPAKGHEALIGTQVRITSRWANGAPRPHHGALLKSFKTGQVVTVNASGPMDNLRLNLDPGQGPAAEEAAQPPKDEKPETVTRPANANDPNRPARQVNHERITGANVDEAAVQVVLKVAPQGPADGTTTFNSIDAAAARAVELLKQGQGVKLLLAPGSYRPADTLSFNATGNQAMSDAVLIIEGDGGKATLSGSVTEGFTPDKWELVDAERRIYRADWPHDWEFIDRGYYSMPHVEMHGRELLALNGMPIAKVQLESYTYRDSQGRIYDSVGNMVGREAPRQGGRSYTGFRGLDPLQPGTFAVNKLGPGEEGYDGAEKHPYPNSLLLRLPDDAKDIRDVKIEVGMLGHLLDLQAKSNVVLRNLVIEHSAAYANGSPGSAIRTNAWNAWGAPHGNWLIENCEFSRNGNEGLTIFWVRNITARNVKIEDNGGRGAFLQHIQNCIFEDVDVLRNNWMGGHYGFIKHSVGGIDWRAQDALFRRIRCNENWGTGFRGDVVASNLIYEDSQFNNNRSVGNRRANGMFHEISWGPILLKNCELSGNEGRGFFYLNVHDITLDGCRLIDNTLGAISVMSQPTRHTYFDMNNPGGQNELAGGTNVPIPTSLHTVVRNCVIAGRGAESFLIERSPDEGNAQSYQEWYQDHYTGENNQFWHPSISQVFNVGAQFKPRQFTDLEGWRRATGEDATSTWAPPEAHR